MQAKVEDNVEVTPELGEAGAAAAERERHTRTWTWRRRRGQAVSGANSSTPHQAREAQAAECPSPPRGNGRRRSYGRWRGAARTNSEDGRGERTGFGFQNSRTKMEKNWTPRGSSVKLHITDAPTSFSFRREYMQLNPRHWTELGQVTTKYCQRRYKHAPYTAKKRQHIINWHNINMTTFNSDELDGKFVSYKLGAKQIEPLVLLINFFLKIITRRIILLNSINNSAWRQFCQVNTKCCQKRLYTCTIHQKRVPHIEWQDINVTIIQLRWT
jgi:hypothetical protein